MQLSPFLVVLTDYCCSFRLNISLKNCYYCPLNCSFFWTALSFPFSCCPVFLSAVLSFSLSQCYGSGKFIPDPNFFRSGSRIRIKEFKYFNLKKLILSSQKYDPGCSSRIRIRIFSIPDLHQRIYYFNPKNCFQALSNIIRVVHPGSGSWFFTHPEGLKRHWIPNPDPQHCSQLFSFFYFITVAAGPQQNRRLPAPQVPGEWEA